MHVERFNSAHGVVIILFKWTMYFPPEGCSFLSLYILCFSCQSSILADEATNAAMLAMSHWMNHTCIQFVPRSDSDSDYVLFVEYSG